MRRFILTFSAPELESSYQLTQLAQTKKPVYIFMIFAALFLNLGALCTHFLSTPIGTWYLNVSMAAFCFIQIIVIVVRNQFQYIQIALTITSISMGFLELNVNSLSTTKSEFFAYGNVFTQLSVVLYFISDFPHAIVQIVSHYIVRTVITTILSSTFDYLVFGAGFITAILILITIYVKDLNARKIFLLNLKEHNFLTSAAFIIDKPFIIFNFNFDQLSFQVTQDNLINRFPGYQEELCNGCNTRTMLRSYYCGKEQQLEQMLLNKDSLQLPCVFFVKYKKQRHTVKLCLIDVQQNTYVLILEEKGTCEQIQTSLEEQKLKSFLKRPNYFFHQKMMRWGVLSVLLLPSQILQKVDFENVLKRILFIYSKKIFSKLDVKINSENAEYQIITYIHQLKIFLIQLFEILLEIQEQNNQQISIILSRKENSINLEVIVEIENMQRFCKLLQNNYFIKQTSKLVIDNNQQFQNHNATALYFKNYPPDSYYQRKLQ